jgi:hypothetical protein
MILEGLKLKLLKTANKNFFFDLMLNYSLNYGGDVNKNMKISFFLKGTDLCT